MTFVPAICRACDRLRGPSLPPSIDWPGGKKVQACDAFPDGIPEAIAFGGDHRKPFEGDHGLQFRQRPTDDARQAFDDWNATFGQAG